MKKIYYFFVLFIFIILFNCSVYATDNMENTITDFSITNEISTEIENNNTNYENSTTYTSDDFNLINENIIKIDKDLQFIISFFCLLSVLILFILLYRFFSWFFPI